MQRHRRPSITNSLRRSPRRQDREAECALTRAPQFERSRTQFHVLTASYREPTRSALGEEDAQTDAAHRVHHGAEPGVGAERLQVVDGERGEDRRGNGSARFRSSQAGMPAADRMRRASSNGTHRQRRRAEPPSCRPCDRRRGRARRGAAAVLSSTAWSGPRRLRSLAPAGRSCTQGKASREAAVVVAADVNSRTGRPPCRSGRSRRRGAAGKPGRVAPGQAHHQPHGITGMKAIVRAPALAARRRVGPELKSSGPSSGGPSGWSAGPRPSTASRRTRRPP